MQRSYFSIVKIPDLTLIRYSSRSSSDVPGVVSAHGHFWRQLNRTGLLNGEAYHLFYEYNPGRRMGDRMRVGIAVDSPDISASFMKEVMASSALGPYFEISPARMPDEAPEEEFDPSRRYRYGAHLYKAEMFLSPKEHGGNPYYVASEWEMNDEGRLYTMMKLMAEVNRPCVYVVSIYPRDLTRHMTDCLDRTLYELRECIKPQASRIGGGASVNSKDEHAKDALDYYEDLLENLADNPHFLVDVQVLSDDRQHAGIILDAAASEALSAGNHQVAFFEQNMSLNDLCEENFCCCADPKAPKTLNLLPQIMLLEEMAHFAVFPVLYGGEWTEIPKETAPKAVTNGLLLGLDEMGHEINFPIGNLSKHAFLAGVPGSGKTNSMMHLIYEMHGRYGIPVLIFEPAKHEYRTLTCVDGLKDISLFSPSARTHFPLHINPFEFPIGMTLAEHIRNLIAVFDGAFSLEPPMPFLLDASIQEVYEDAGWHSSMINVGKLVYPTMGRLYTKLAEKLEKTDYGPEVKGNLKSALQVRIGSLITREMSDIFDVGESTVPPEEWLNRSAIIELESLGKDPANFTTLLIATLVREALKTNDYIKPKDGRPRHVMFFEEAHNLIGPSAVPVPGEADPKTAATAYIVKMLAEVRALGEGIVIADQLPTAMAPEIIKNTSLKIGLRITSQDDRELLGGTMSANPEQIEEWSVYLPGHGLISYEALLKPFKVRLPYFEAKEGDLNDRAVLVSIGAGPCYIRNMIRSLDIMIDRWNERKKALMTEFEKHRKLIADIRRQIPPPFVLDRTDPKYEPKKKLVDLHNQTMNKVTELRKQAVDISLKAFSYYATVCFIRDENFYEASEEPELFRRFAARLDEAVEHIEDPLNAIVAFQDELMKETGKPPNRMRGYALRKDLIMKTATTWEEL